MNFALNSEEQLLMMMMMVVNSVAINMDGSSIHLAKSARMDETCWTSFQGTD